VCEVGEEATLVIENLRPDGNVKLRGGAGRTVFERAAAGSAARRLDMLIRTKCRQIPEVVISDEHDVAARTTVAAVRSSLRDVLLPAERETAVTAAAGLNVESDAVVEHQRISRKVGG
jgi:hypothetical protein